MEGILKLLARGLDWEVRDHVMRRYGALVRDYEYLAASEDENVKVTAMHGWSAEKFRLLFALNSFYQLVVGPLASSARGTARNGIGSTVPILFGQLVFDKKRNSRINKMYDDFLTLCRQNGFDEWLLIQNRASDVVYQVRKEVTGG